MIYALLILVIAGLVALLVFGGLKLLRYHRKYSKIVDVEAEVAKLEKGRVAIASDFESLQQRHNMLQVSVRVLEEEDELQQVGLYRPKFAFDNLVHYESRLASIREEQKQMTRDKVAATCSTQWQVSGSAAKGRKMANNQIKLVLRAFNGECDVAVGKVTYKNIAVMEKRINKAYEVINKLSKENDISINPKYAELRIHELKLVHEFNEKKQEEKEEQRRIREQMREEERALKEIEKAREKAEQEEQRYHDALEKAKQEVSTATGAKQQKMMETIQKLEQALKEAQENKVRAMSRAQMTRSGHVYVISNLGSFGDRVYKIGMTRRLEPMDRVKELGDASVPESGPHVQDKIPLELRWSPRRGYDSFSSSPSLYFPSMQSA